MRELAVLEEGRPETVADLEPGEDYFAALGSGFGAHALRLSIGPLSIRLEGLSGEQERTLGARYRPFAAGDPGAGWDIAVRLVPAGVPAFLRHPAPGERETYRLSARNAAGRLAVWSYEFAGRVDAARRSAVVAVVEPAGPLFERGLENFLRVLTATCVLDRGGFLLHASAIVRGGRAYVFFGPSGSGKTTVTDLSPEDVVLSDDMTLVVPRAGRLEAAGIPFGLAHHRPPEHAGSFPIASFNRLVQAPRVRRERIGGAQAVAEILASLPFVLQDTRQGDEAVRVVGQALEGTPVYRLEFRKDASFWDAVQEGA